jgi:hypothetical protein
MGITDEKSGSEKDITPEEKRMEKTFQWTDQSQFVSVDDLEGSTSHSMESPPHGRDDVSPLRKDKKRVTTMTPSDLRDDSIALCPFLAS